MSAGRGGVNVKTFVEFKFPFSDLSCYDEPIFRSNIEAELVNNSTSIWTSIERGIRAAESNVVAYYCCSPDGRSRSSCSGLLQFEQADISFSEEDVDYSGFYMTPTGKLVHLSSNIEFVSCFNSSNPAPEAYAKGSLFAFRIEGGEKWYATRSSLDPNKFTGYYRKNPTDHKPYGDPYKFEQVSVGPESFVEVRTTIDYPNCKTYVVSFDYQVPSGYVNTDNKGGVELPKLPSLPFSFDPQISVVTPFQSGLDNYPLVTRQEMLSYFEFSVDFMLMDDVAFKQAPCPDIPSITANDLNTLSSKKVKILEDGSYVHYTTLGYFYYQLQSASDYLIYAYIPNREIWVPFTPGSWTTTSDVFDAVMLEIMDASNWVALWNYEADPHVILAIISTSEIPIVSQAADIIDAGIYLIEEKPGEAALSLAGVVLASRVVTQTVGKVIIRFKKLRKYNASTNKFQEEFIDALQDYASRLEMPEEQAIRIQKVLSRNTEIANRVKNNENALGALKFLDDAGIKRVETEFGTEDLDLLDNLANDLQNVAELEGFFKGVNGVTNTGGIKAWKKFLDDGLPPAFRRNITNLKQRSLIDEYASGIANASNSRKGNFGEVGADLDLNAKSYESLLDRIDDIDAPGHNGIDGVFQKNGEYFIVEGKYTGSASLNPANPATGLERQMSDAWIADKLPDAVGNDLAQDIIFQGYSRVLAKVAPDGSVTYKYVSDTGYLTQGGGPLGDFIP